MRYLKTLLFVLFSVGLASAQHHLNFKVNGLQPGDDLILAYYYADQNRIVDTAKVDGGGIAEFKGEENLLNGVYIVVLPKKTYIEFIVPNDDQEFTIEFDTSLSPAKKSVQGSLDNQLFFDFEKFAVGPGKGKREKIKEFRECETEDCKNKIRSQIKVLDDQVDNRRREIIENHPTTFTSKLFKAVLDIEIPEELKTDTTGLRYEYFRDHYWDNFDLTDDGMLRTPVFKSKLEYYFDKVILQVPDTIIPAIDKLTSHIENGGAKELYHYVVWWCTNHHEESKVMCMDKVLHHMAKNYYCAGKCWWADSSLVAKMCEHTEKIGKSLCGLVAPNMTLVDTTFVRNYELHKLNSPVTVVVFWDHQCGHCKKEIPKLKEMYDTMHDKGVEVYAIYTQADWEGWKKYIRKNGLTWLNVMDAYNKATYRKDYNIISTPQLYLLDHDKKIMYKNPPAENVGQIVKIMLEQYEKQKNP